VEELGDKKKAKQRRQSASRLRPQHKPLSFSARREFSNRSCHHAKETWGRKEKKKLNSCLSSFDENYESKKTKN